MERHDVAIVGAGIAGLSLAWHLLRAGKSVVVLEQSAKAEGASTRNFGMVWVVGQPNGDVQDIAFRSRHLWQEAADDLGFWISDRGSLTLAYEALEFDVLHEFLTETNGEFGRFLITPEEVSARCPGVRLENLKGALYSPTEKGVDPREVVHAAAQTLTQRGIDIRFNSSVVAVEPKCVRLATGEEVQADKIVVCPGPKLFDLFPNECEHAGLTPSRLQMMRLKPVSSDVPALEIHLCAGLTLAHYANFRNCSSLLKLKEFHRSKWPIQVERGIHVLVAEHSDGTITVGDSHEYGRGLSAYRDESTDEAILNAMDEFLPRDRYEVVQRWEGTYNTHSTLPYWWQSLQDSVWALNLFGTGMTLSFGLTERLSKELI
jgi:FAD dependent oxidoreductase TIGR03364